MREALTGRGEGQEGGCNRRGTDGAVLVLMGAVRRVAVEALQARLPAMGALDSSSTLARFLPRGEKGEGMRGESPRPAVKFWETPPAVVAAAASLERTGESVLNCYPRKFMTSCQSMSSDRYIV